jgi:glycosyltransferase involved in cell wall biosynthesis
MTDRLRPRLVSDPAAGGGLSVALVHEWLDDRAGSEQTFERMARRYPEAQLYALTRNPDVEFAFDRPVTTTFLQRSAWLREHRSVSLPLMPLAWMLMPRVEADIVVTSSHAFSRFVRSRARLVLSYVYTPMRYAWQPDVDTRGAGKLTAPARAALKALDRRSTRRVDAFAGISTEVVHRIQDFYDREARVIFPPVDLARFSPGAWAERGDFILGVSRWIPYKRLDLVIQVGEALRMPVIIAGRGPEGQALRQLARRASVVVEVVESPSDEDLAELYRRCRLLVFPAIEDFGIVPVEAHACGAPVVALAQGGTRDIVADGRTGALSNSQSLRDLVDACRRALTLGDVTAAAARQAQMFSTPVFEREFGQWIEDSFHRVVDERKGYR